MYCGEVQMIIASLLNGGVAGDPASECRLIWRLLSVLCSQLRYQQNWNAACDAISWMRTARKWDSNCGPYDMTSSQRNMCNALQPAVLQLYRHHCISRTRVGFSSEWTNFCINRYGPFRTAKIHLALYYIGILIASDAGRFSCLFVCW